MHGHDLPELPGDVLAIVELPETDGSECTITMDSRCGTDTVLLTGILRGIGAIGSA